MDARKQKPAPQPNEDDVLRRMLAIPPTPHVKKVKPKKKRKK